MAIVRTMDKLQTHAQMNQGTPKDVISTADEAGLTWFARYIPPVTVFDKDLVKH
jgi:hypothetical protein